jgi:diamine N-acetyltransferase
MTSPQVYIMPTVHFIPLQVADAEALSAVALCAYRDHYLDYWYDQGEWYMQHSFSVSQLSMELADSNARCFMIEWANKSVGFLKINLDKPLSGNTPADEPTSTDMELERIYLTKDTTGHGVGQAAMLFVEKLAQERSKKTLWLKAMDSSAAVGFYERMGFAVYGTHQLSFPQMKESLRGMVIMRKRVG